MSHGCGGTVSFGSPSASDAYFTGWPSYVIDASAVRNRAMQWLDFLFGVTGELYYETAMAYSHDPWSNQWDFSGNGDGTLFYPGTPSRIGGSTHIPVASLRLAQIRDGMEDFEYLKLVADLGGPGLARSLAAGLFPHPYATEVAPAQLLAARARLAARIVELPGGVDTAPAPDAAPAPDPAAPGGSTSAPRGGCHSGGSAGLIALLGLAALALRRRS